MDTIKGQVNLIFGAFEFDRVPEDDRVRMMQIAEQAGIGGIDCGVIYKDVQPLLARLGVAGRFELHGKSAPSRNKRDQLIDAASISLRELGVKQLDSFLVHAPDPSTPMEETCEAIQELYNDNVFKRFGLSNHLPEDIEKIHAYMHSKGYVLPTLYEGYYNAVARRCEKDLFPVLRRLGIAFLCYSPLGGGYFMTTPKAIEEGEQHRFNKNGLEGLVFRAMFMKPSYLKALDSWHDLSRNSKLSAAELAFRWISSHSALSQGLGDAIILGPETPEQLEELLTWRSKGALPASVLDQIDRIWESCENEAALDCVNGWMDDLKAGRVQPPDGYEY